MNLRVFQPANIVLDETVSKVTGESPSGSFVILPRHIDISTALVPGLLSYLAAGGSESFIALDGGILVKQGETVSIATRMAVMGELGELKAAVDKFLGEVDEREKKTRAAIARLEADLVRRFVEFGKRG